MSTLFAVVSGLFLSSFFFTLHFAAAASSWILQIYQLNKNRFFVSLWLVAGFLWWISILSRDLFPQFGAFHYCAVWQEWARYVFGFNMIPILLLYKLLNDKHPRLANFLSVFFFLLNVLTALLLNTTRLINLDESSRAIDFFGLLNNKQSSLNTTTTTTTTFVDGCQSHDVFYMLEAAIVLCIFTAVSFWLIIKRVHPKDHRLLSWSVLLAWLCLGVQAHLSNVVNLSVFGHRSDNSEEDLGMTGFLLYCNLLMVHLPFAALTYPSLYESLFEDEEDEDVQNGQLVLPMVRSSLGVEWKPW